MLTPKENITTEYRKGTLAEEQHIDEAADDVNVPDNDQMAQKKEGGIMPEDKEETMVLGETQICKRTDCIGYNLNIPQHCGILADGCVQCNGNGCSWYKTEAQERADEANLALHKRGLKVLDINPKFRDLIPKMSDEEFAQLEENIVNDGVIREPIVYWHGMIIDGHHRYEIAQRHPEIKYTTVEKVFDSEEEALLWICQNQLGRRNLTDKDRTYLLGAQAEMAKKVSGGTGANQYTKEQVGQNDQPAKGRGTALQVANQNHVGEKTVRRAEQFKKGVDVADSISPGLGIEIRSGKKKVSKQTMEKLVKADPETQKEVVKDIKEGKPEKAKKKLDPWPDKIELAEGDSYSTTTVFKRAESDEVVEPHSQETCLNKIRGACEDLEENVREFLDEYAKTDIDSRCRDEAMIILNDMKETVQTAIKKLEKEKN